MATPIGEQITTAQAELRTKTARFEELIALESADGHLEEAQVVERDALNEDIKGIAGRIERMKTLEAAQSAQLRPVLTKAANVDTREQATNPRTRPALVSTTGPSAAKDASGDATQEPSPAPITCSSARRFIRPRRRTADRTESRGHSRPDACA